MRHGRAKAARKTLQYFHRTVGLKPPYWILLDATFVVAMFQQKILPLRERVDRVLQTPNNVVHKFCIAQVAVNEMTLIYEDLVSKEHPKAPSFQQAIDWVRKECIVLKSGLESDEVPIPAEPKKENKNNKKRKKRKAGDADLTPVQRALHHHIENDEKPYVVASQDEVLLGRLRNMGTVPILRLANQSVLILEQPSKQSQSQDRGSEKKKWIDTLPESERALVDLVRSENKQAKAAAAPAPKHRTKAKAKAPNPLSCKRKKQDDNETNQGSKLSASQKRRQRAKRAKTEG